MYKDYVKTLLTRKNTITGVVYSEDPTVFAWELANEPETSPNYEINLGIKPGSLVYNWLDEMSAYVKSLDPNHMVSIQIHWCFDAIPASSLVGLIGVRHTGSASLFQTTSCYILTLNIDSKRCFPARDAYIWRTCILHIQRKTL